jgi:hypothetical protein
MFNNFFLIFFCIIYAVSYINGNFLDRLATFLFKKDETSAKYEEIEADSLILIPTKIGFDKGVNRLTLLGESFPLLKLNEFQNINLYTYVCSSIDDENCNWEKFKNTIEYNRILLRRYNRDELKLFHLFVVCESLQGQHESCPDPCSQNNLCNNELKCAKTFWGLYKTDYMCICDQNKVWNDELKKCIDYDICFWKSGVTCPPERKICLLTEAGNYTCVAERYKKMNKTCEYKCEDQIDKDCIEQLSYFYHKIENDQPICGNGSCVVNSTARYGFICKCEEGWIDNYENKYSDCSINTRTDCYDQKYSCINGECEWNIDEQIYNCKCHKGYGGESCDKPESLWFPWQEWSTCHANCNTEGIRVRKRDCNGELAECRKPKKERKFKCLIIK